jgi:transcriptional regulator with XRE-family HTH domain
VKTRLPELNARELLALNLVALRRARGLSQEALAFEAQLHRTFVAHVERRARNISLDNIEALAKALGVTMVDMFAPPPQ